MMRHFGVLIPATNTTVEMEYTRLLPPTLQVHVGRLCAMIAGHTSCVVPLCCQDILR